MPKRGPTPMMEQYLGIKAQHPDKIVLFRMGDFYETFYDDAEDAAALLGITLTAREKKGDTPIPLAGVPYHALDHYLPKLLDAGRTVAICEQMEDPAQTKGLVRRDVVEILSPGTVTNPALLSGEESAYLLALAPGPDAWGYALLDGSTGELRCGEMEPGEIAGLVARPDVRELVVPDRRPAGTPEPWAELGGSRTVTEASSVLFGSEYAPRALTEHFGVRGLEGLGLAELPLAAIAAGAALRYLADCQRTAPTQVQELQVDRQVDTLYLDRETASHLELFDPLRPGDRDATLFHHLQDTRTPMGRRTLAHWLRSPRTDLATIQARHDAVEWLVEDLRALHGFRDALGGVGDLERILGRVATRRALPHEMAALRDGLLRLPDAGAALAESPHPPLRAVAELGPRVRTVAAPLRDQLVETPPSHLRTGGIFQDGVDPELDRLLALSRGGKDWIARHQQEERERTGIPSLKVSYNKVFGYYLEVTNPHLSKVPDDYQEKQTLTNARRFVSPALKEKEREILGAEEARVAYEAESFRRLLDEVAADLAELRRILSAVATADALASLAQVARDRGYTRPEMDEGGRLEIEGGRHPVVERLVGEPFIPNDLRMDPDGRQLLLLTGPNMGGKSTYLRQAALFVVMAQMGSFLPARSARIGVVDRLFTRVGASDNLSRGQSTFLVEMAETAKILRNATDRSLVVLDEVGRGTSTHDGRSLAWAITEYLHDGPHRPKTLFATHFHELTRLAERLPRATNLQMQVEERDGRILFLHRVVPGASDRSYGVHVAELAGVPRAVLVRATELLESPAALEEAAGSNGTKAADPSPGPPELPLFAPPEHEVLDALRGLDCDQMRPLDALNLLADLARRLDR